MSSSAEFNSNQTWLPTGREARRLRKKEGIAARATREQKATLSDLAKVHTEIALKALVAVATKSESDSARVAAAKAILDRGHGKPTQAHQHSGAIGSYDLTRISDGDVASLKPPSVRLPTLAEIRAERRRREQERDRERLARDVETIRTGCTTLVRPGGSPSHHLGFQPCVAKIEMA
ncbi:hypothetical protein GGC47_004564 [Bosea sp. OAE752]|uniref:hypothetical protein n=1 Tax=Bosea sp. OAE752 TaxID=2663873 RepID=UPI003D1A32E4